MKKYIISALVLGVIISGLMANYIWNTETKDNPENSKITAFSREAWEHYPEQRSVMVDDLLENYDFSNMTKKDVMDLLGDRLLDAGDNVLRYETKGGFFQDEVLQFLFDENGKFMRVSIAN